MQNIEITTAHNIVFQYELTSVILRSLATIVDLIIMGVYFGLASYVFGGHTLLQYVLIFLVIIFYHLFFEIFNQGQSPGKMALKIRVVSLNGASPSVNDYFTRWIFRLIDITFSFGTLAFLFASASEKSQRIGDIMAQTTVVNLKTFNSVQLKDLIELGEHQAQHSFVGLDQFNDDDMLLLKNSIKRYATNKSEENKAVLKQIGSVLKEKLNLPHDTKINLELLNNILKEYIILTR